MNELNDRLREILYEHFDPRWGTPYWLRKQAEYAFDPRQDITTMDALEQFGPMPLELLSTLPVEDFIPRKYHDRLREFVTAETGGTTGPPKRTAYLASEFQEAFIEPFLAAADVLRFPRDHNWLYIGPSGPHVIGKAARECAVAMGSIDPFTVDLDPRWVRKLAPGSLARQRYIEHVIGQAEAVLRSQDIGVLFATPPTLAALGERLDDVQREAIVGVHLGGVAADQTFWDSITKVWFPNAVVMAGYGNSLAGMCPQISYSPGELPSYFPHGNRLVLDTHSPDDDGRGQVVFHRLDRSCFLPNVHERDQAQSVRLDNVPPWTGFQGLGILDPRPAKEVATPLQEVLY